MSTIKRICARCNRVLGYTEGYGVEGVSHGLCVPCRDATLREAGLDVPETFATDYGKELDMAHEPATCTNPMCSEPACMETRKNREVQRLLDYGEDDFYKPYPVKREKGDER